MVMGSPAKVKRTLSEGEFASIGEYAARYVGYKNIYRSEVTSGE
jgi:carbonic anhydrase/acetyltransferase-like protein (isoleucine patch superfamily)